jgi:lipid-binding SYLF domain-containing protein
MTRFHSLAAIVLGLSITLAAPAANREIKTIEAAAVLIHDFAAPLHHIPPEALRDATGIAVVPHIVRAGLVVDARFGRGVVVVRQPDGGWGNPVFVKLEGIGFGGEAGVEAADLVLVFKTRQGIEHMLKGHEKLTLGTDVAVAAGPVGKETEAAARGRNVAVFSYSRSRGLFAGISVEGAALVVDREANESFYSIRGGHPNEVLAHRAMPAAESIRFELTRLVAPPPPPPPVIVTPAPGFHR